MYSWILFSSSYWSFGGHGKGPQDVSGLESNSPHFLLDREGPSSYICHWHGQTDR